MHASRANAANRYPAPTTPATTATPVTTTTPISTIKTRMPTTRKCTGMNETDMTIYDVLRALVENAKWMDEGILVRMRTAIERAEENEIFRTEGRFKL